MEVERPGEMLSGGLCFPRILRVPESDLSRQKYSKLLHHNAFNGLDPTSLFLLILEILLQSQSS